MPTGVAVLWGLLLLTLPIDQAAPAAPAAATGRIAGRVTVDGADTPVVNARIMLFPTVRPNGPKGPFGPMVTPTQALTDQDGRFVFDKLAPGSYRMDVQKTGFAPLSGPERAPTAQVSAGQTTAIALRLQKGAVIAGKLLDASGEPVTDARIMAMHPINGNRPGAATVRLVPALGGGQQTNDLGEFRIAGLAPGEYYVAAMPRAGSPFGGAAVSPTANGTANTTTYYPGTIEQGSAHTIKVAAGETVDNIVFSMQSVPAFRVSGRVVDENGAPVTGAMVTLMGDPRTNTFMGPIGHARTEDGGRFTIADVPAGTYHVSASVPIVMNSPGGAVSGGVVGGIGAGTYTSWSGGVTNGIDATEVIVNGANVTGIRVVVRRPTPQ
jgi:Carboxypeptidase regulatory-like domain